jgi:hypothetical protein
MAAHKGNKYWEFREKHGRNHKYTPEALWKEALLYFQWVEDNPLWEAIIIQRGIKVKDKKGNESMKYFTKAPKLRAMTVKAFNLYADISHTTWGNYKDNKDFVAITTRIEDVIYSQKFEGAAATLLNPNIIARDLGLKDVSEYNINDTRKSVEDLFPKDSELDEQKDKSKS